jgi:hypothetical protein
MALEKELEVYQRELPKLLSNEGKFVVISGETVEGFWDTYEDALKVAYQKLGTTTPFLVKRIEKVEKVYFFAQPFDACPT